MTKRNQPATSFKYLRRAKIHANDGVRKLHSARQDLPPGSGGVATNTQKHPRHPPIHPSTARVTDAFCDRPEQPEKHALRSGHEPMRSTVGPANAQSELRHRLATWEGRHGLVATADRRPVQYGAQAASSTRWICTTSDSRSSRTDDGRPGISCTHLHIWRPHPLSNATRCSRATP